MAWSTFGLGDIGHSDTVAMPVKDMQGQCSYQHVPPGILLIEKSLIGREIVINIFTYFTCNFVGMNMNAQHITSFISCIVIISLEVSRKAYGHLERYYTLAY